MNSIYMNNYTDIMDGLDGKSDIATDEEMLLFSESEEEDIIVYFEFTASGESTKPKKKLKSKA